MENEIKIKDVLNKFDPNVDGHWTSEGEVRLDMLSNLLKRTVTREEFVAAVGSFNRKNLQAGDQKQDNGTPGTVSEAGEDLESARAAAEKVLAEKNLLLDEAKKARQAASDDLDKIIIAIGAKTSGVTTADTIKAYQKSQQEIRAQTAKAAEVLKATLGPAAKELLKSK